jgi:3-oxoacyl-[acyl-carrier protein] reductase
MSDNRVWLVTGASSGIGLAIARRIAASGDLVALLARGDAVNALAEELGPNTLACQADISQPDDIERAIESIIAHWGRLDVVVNNAGAHRGGKLAKLDPTDWQFVLDTNLTGALTVCKAASPHLPKGGAIVNIGAVVGFRGFPGDSAYAASKAGLAGLTRALSIELARRGITVNLVIPGLVLTEMTSGVSDKAMEAMRDKIPMGRYGEPDEIAEVVEWVARSRYMTGAFVPADGGLMSSFGITG